MKLKDLTDKHVTLSYQGEVFDINEPRRGASNRILMIPYGLTKNTNLLQAQNGDQLHFADGNIYNLLSITNIRTTSPIFEAIALYQYGLSRKEMLEEWKKEYGNIIQYESAILLVYDLKPCTL